MRIKKTIATLTAAAGLSLGLVGLGAGSASAADGCGYGYGYSPNGASYTLCASGGQLSWSVHEGRTDEHMWIEAVDNCGHSWIWDWNNQSSSWADSWYHNMSCGSIYGATLFSSEATSPDGTTASIPEG